MRLTDLTPLGRVPRGEPGCVFWRGKDGNAVPPTQSGIQIAKDSLEHMERAEPPAFIVPGDYMVYACKYDDVWEHAIVALREDEPMVWLIQCDEFFQGDGAKNIMPEGYRWTALKPESAVMDAHRALMRCTMFPEIRNWALISEINGETRIEAKTPEYQAFVEGALSREN